MQWTIPAERTKFKKYSSVFNSFFNYLVWSSILSLLLPVLFCSLITCYIFICYYTFVDVYIYIYIYNKNKKCYTKRQKKPERLVKRLMNNLIEVKTGKSVPSPWKLDDYDDDGILLGVDLKPSQRFICPVSAVLGERQNKLSIDWFQFYMWVNIQS